MELTITKTQRAQMHVALSEILGDSPQAASYIESIAWNTLDDTAEIMSLAAATESAVDKFLVENDFENCAVDVSQLAFHQPNVVTAMRIAGLVQDGVSRQWATGIYKPSLPVLVLPETILQDWMNL